VPSADKKIVVITAPSGSGKTTLVRKLMQACPQLGFSVSACTRAPRGMEVDGRDYHFLTEERFRALIEQDAFVEWEMVYAGKYYGTLRAELERIWAQGCYPLVDIDVKGALALQEAFPDTSLTIFIQAPSLEVLRQRLTTRGTETPQSLDERLSKATFELSYAPQFDRIIVNDDLDGAVGELVRTVQDFLALEPVVQ
jgi:guanylate kinase